MTWCCVISSFIIIKNRAVLMLYRFYLIKYNIYICHFCALPLIMLIEIVKIKSWYTIYHLQTLLGTIILCMSIFIVVGLHFYLLCCVIFIYLLTVVTVSTKLQKQGGACLMILFLSNSSMLVVTMVPVIISLCNVMVMMIPFLITMVKIKSYYYFAIFS